MHAALSGALQQQQSCSVLEIKCQLAAFQMLFICLDFVLQTHVSARGKDLCAALTIVVRFCVQMRWRLCCSIESCTLRNVASCRFCAVAILRIGLFDHQDLSLVSIFDTLSCMLWQCRCYRPAFHASIIIADVLPVYRYQYRRLDGTMSVAARDTSITDFKTLRGVDVLLVSLKAAALGLNLTAANHVVLMDPWFNPTIEDQAIDRAHRIGQTKDVHVTRITIAGTSIVMQTIVCMTINLQKQLVLLYKC